MLRSRPAPLCVPSPVLAGPVPLAIPALSWFQVVHSRVVSAFACFQSSLMIRCPLLLPRSACIPIGKCMLPPALFVLESSLGLSSCPSPRPSKFFVIVLVSELRLSSCPLACSEPPLPSVPPFLRKVSNHFFLLVNKRIEAPGLLLSST